MTLQGLQGWQYDRLVECERSMGRKCFLLDSAQLAHGVQVVVYGPEPVELDGYLHIDTRVAVFVEGDNQARMSCIVDSRTEKIADILARHGMEEQ